MHKVGGTNARLDLLMMIIDKAQALVFPKCFRNAVLKNQSSLSSTGVFLPQSIQEAGQLMELEAAANRLACAAPHQVGNGQRQPFGGRQIFVPLSHVCEGNG